MGGLPLLAPVLSPRSHVGGLGSEASEPSGDYLHPLPTAAFGQLDRDHRRGGTQYARSQATSLPLPTLVPTPAPEPRPPLPEPNLHPTPTSSSSLSTLADLRERGMLDDDEYEKAKARGAATGDLA